MSIFILSHSTTTDDRINIVGKSPERLEGRYLGDVHKTVIYNQIILNVHIIGIWNKTKCKVNKNNDTYLKEGGKNTYAMFTQIALKICVVKKSFSIFRATGERARLNMLDN